MKLQETHWAFYFLFWFLTVTGAGALIGAIAFPLFGPFFGSNLTPLQHILAGARHLAFVALIWAPGIALVFCVIRAYHKKHPPKFPLGRQP